MEANWQSLASIGRLLKSGERGRKKQMGIIDVGEEHPTLAGYGIPTRAKKEEIG
jgi:hypothetical protein